MRAESIQLSDAALVLLRTRLAGEWVGVTDDNRPIYRELVAAGLMYPVSTFLHGKEGYYRPTEAAFNGLCTPPPSRAEAPVPRD
jgi:hypothetical protein